MSIPPDKFEKFTELPPEMQSKIVSSMGEKEAYNFVLTNASYFINNLKHEPELAEKYYTYLFNNKAFAVLEGLQGAPHKTQEFADRLFSAEGIDSSVEEFFLTKDNIENYVTRLNLSRYTTDELDAVIDNLPNQLDKLESLDLSKSSINATQLEKLLQKCPNIKTLNLSGIKGLKDLHLDKVKLNSLQTLHLNSISLRQSDFYEILQATPSIKKITLEYCNVNNKLNLKGLQLPHLKNVVLSSTYFRQDGINEFLKACPNLTTLQVRNIAGLNYWNPSIQLKKLKHLNCQASFTFKPDELNKFLKIAPQLESLDISHCRKLKGLNFSQKIETLKEIRAIDSDLEDVDQKELQSLAPNAKIIT